LDVVPARLDPDVDVDPTGSGGLRIADEAMLLQHLLRAHCHLAHRVPADARLWVEVDSQLVGVVEVAATNRVRVEVDDPQVDRPGEVGRVVRYELGGGPAAREGEGRRLQPVRGALRDAL